MTDPRTAPTTPLADDTILGFPAEPDEDEDDEPPGEALPVELVVVRHPDRIACALLILAGVAANASLALAWLADSSTSGLALVSRGVDVLGDGVGALLRTDLWQPVVVVLGGGLLVLLGVAQLVPARAHRSLGVLALLVALATAAALLVLFTQADWRVERFGIGTWFAVAVPVLGVLGALKSMLTTPDVTLVPRRV